MKILPTLSQLPAGTTKGDLINQVDPQVAYDTALPQEWVDRVTRKGFDPRGQVVWAYPHGYICGMPMPLTEEARRTLHVLQEPLWEDQVKEVPSCASK